MTVISVANLTIELRNKYKYTKELCAEYISSAEPDFSVGATEEELDREAAVSDFPTTRGYLESVVLYRNIAERLPEYDGVVFHGAVIALDGVAYLVTAKSGVGKTTHLRLWQEEFGSEVHILNGDKPIIRLIDGVAYACGTPWRGKEFFGVNEMLPLGGIAFLERAAENSVSEVLPAEVLNAFVSQAYIPKSPVGARRGLLTLNRILTSVPLFKLCANMQPEAAHIAMAAFTKKKIK